MSGAPAGRDIVASLESLVRLRERRERNAAERVARSRATVREAEAVLARAEAVLEAARRGRRDVETAEYEAMADRPVSASALRALNARLAALDGDVSQAERRRAIAARQARRARERADDDRAALMAISRELQRWRTMHQDAFAEWTRDERERDEQQSEDDALDRHGAQLVSPVPGGAAGEL